MNAGYMNGQEIIAQHHKLKYGFYSVNKNIILVIYVRVFDSIPTFDEVAYSTYSDVCNFGYSRLLELLV